MNWINLNVAVLDSEEFIGADPTGRATWLCLLRYCAGQENGGRIVGARQWKDRKWQQVVRVTLKEISAQCDLWRWEGDDLIVEFYPEEKEHEVRTMRDIGSAKSERKSAAARENGKRGGRPKNPTEPNGKPNEEEPNPTQREPIERKGKEGEEKGSTPKPPFENPIADEQPPLCSLEQAIDFAPMCRMTEDGARYWWHTRNASGWTRSSAGGGAARRITSWKSDMAASVQWAHEGAVKTRQTDETGRRRGFTSSDVGL